MNDLANHHSPISDIFPRLDTIDRISYELSADQLDFYKENGYVAGIRILEDHQIELLKEELTTLVQPDHEGFDLWYEYHTNESMDPNTVLFHALGAWRIRPGFHDILWHPAFLIPASQLLCGSIRMWHDQLFCKPANHGGVVAWHQDYSYWTETQPMAHLTCWIGLDDATRNNGCLQYIPGSHRWDLLPITGLAGDMEAIREVLSEEQRDQFNNPVAIELKAGECAFHHPLMVHGSFENRTSQPRRATVINVFKDGVCSAQDEPILDGTNPIPNGRPMSGKFHPLLYAHDSIDV